MEKNTCTKSMLSNKVQVRTLRRCQTCQRRADGSGGRPWPGWISSPLTSCFARQRASSSYLLSAVGTLYSASGTGGGLLCASAASSPSITILHASPFQIRHPLGARWTVSLSSAGKPAVSRRPIHQPNDWIYTRRHCYYHRETRN
jgi:hypothetical protein